MMAEDWFVVLVTSCPCYIVVSLAVWGSGFRTNGVNTCCLISCWEGVGRRLSREVGWQWIARAEFVKFDVGWRFEDVGSGIKLKMPYTAE